MSGLKGKIVGINGFSTSGHLWLKAALDKHGLSDADVTITPVPFSAMQEALAAGKIDIGMFPQPYAALAEKQMRVRKIFDAKYGMPFDEELNVLVGKDAFLKKNGNAVRALLEDLSAAMQFYLSDPRAARQALIDARMVRADPEVYMTMRDYYRDPSLRVDADALEQMQAFQIKATSRVDPSVSQAAPATLVASAPSLRETLLVDRTSVKPGDSLSYTLSLTNAGSVEQKATPKETLAITLVRSPIGTPKSHRIILRGLGLRRLRHTVIRPNTPQVKGLVHKLAYLLEVREAGKAL